MAEKTTWRPARGMERRIREFRCTKCRTVFYTLITISQQIRERREEAGKK